VLKRTFTISQIRARLVLLLLVTLVAVLGASLASAVMAGGGHGAGAESPAASGMVSVTTDASSYAPGDSVTVTLVNGTSTAIAPLGGIVCQGSPWPFTVQRMDDAGIWQDLVFPPTPPCIGIAVALLGPGESQTRTFAADANAGTYRVLYAYNPTDGSGQARAMSDPYDVSTAPVQPTDETGSGAAPPPVGYLEGQVTIGPLQPVQRVGVPPPTPSPAACTARGLVVYQADIGVEAARFALGPDCTYSVALAPGDYRVELDRRGIDRSMDLPRVVTITAGQTTRLDVSIDTGIR
jgi:hypothetical protein